MKRYVRQYSKRYSDTLRLPKTDFPLRPDRSKDHELRKANTQALYDWQRENLSSKEYILHDGPPYANGDVHIGHALNKILKDIILRTKVLQKVLVNYRPGWDCHGLPIELKAQKQGGDIRRDARILAQEAMQKQSGQFQAMAIMADWKQPYNTMGRTYEDAQLEVFGKMVEKGLIHRAYKPVYWSPATRTALAEAELEYKDNHISHSAYVLYRMADADSYLMIWTTTPWTIPANRAIAYNRDLEYVYILADDKKIIVAKDLLEQLRSILEFTELGPATLGTHYRDCFTNELRPILEADFVFADSGTGLVHCAPGHGREDYLLCKDHSIEPFSPVDDDGRFTDAVIHPNLIGLEVQNEGSREVVRMLGECGHLTAVKKYKHKYPYDWRSKTPVIMRATRQLFASLEPIKDTAVDALSAVTMIPESGRSRLTSYIQNRSEWCISRQRAWGVPIPMLSDLQDVPKSIEWLKQHGTDAWFAGDRPKETLDVWFDSGCSWSALDGKQADLYLEGSDQHRGWFQSSLLTSIAVRAMSPYKCVLTHGFVLDSKGRKMSKSIGNVIDPSEIMRELGIDALRLWVAQSDYSADVSISKAILAHVSESLRKIRTTIRFFLGNLNFSESTDLCDIDKYAIHKSDVFRQTAQRHYDEFAFNKVVSLINNHTNGFLSSFYFDTLKDRLYADDESRSYKSAQAALWRLFKDYLYVLAPICPIIVTEAWRHLPLTEPHIYASNFNKLEPIKWSAENEDRWSTLLDIKELCNKLLEQVRARKQITSSLQVDVSLKHAFEVDMANLLIVSRVSDTCEGEVLASGEVRGYLITLHRASGQKCQRCWMHTAEEDLCTRCQNVLNQ